MEAGTRLAARYKGEQRTCEVVQTDDGLRYKTDDGELFQSPSSAAEACDGRDRRSAGRYGGLLSVSGARGPFASRLFFLQMTSSSQFTYCPNCGRGLRLVEAAGRNRRACLSCGYVQYQNPAVGVAAVIQDSDGRVLFCRKRRTGGWSFPSGYVEWGEDIRDALVREVQEELSLTIEVGDVVAVHSNFHDRERQTVGVWFYARVTAGQLRLADDEIDDARYFRLDELPEPAFPTDALVITQLRRR